MKITRVETIPIRVPIKPELAIRGGRGLSHSVSPFLLVKIHSDSGLVGVGEASCTPRWSGEDQVTAAHFINAYFAPFLVGQLLDDVAQIATNCASAVAGNFFTKAAVEMALWDLIGKTEGRPVCQMLGVPGQGGQRGGFDSATVPTKWSVSGVEPAKAAEIARWAVAVGFSSMKVKVGIDAAGDVARVRAVREAVGRNVRIGVDANGGWASPRIAIDTICKLVDECGIFFAEQPVRAGFPAAMAEVRRNVPVPIIADESVYTHDDARILADAEAADVFSIYVGKAGGIGPALAIAEFAKSAGLLCTIGSNLELGVGSAAMIQLAHCAPSIDAEKYPCDIIGPLYYEDDVLAEPLFIRGGFAKGHDRPGLGIELADEKVERYRVR